MSKIRTLATVALMAGLVGGAYWVAAPSNRGSETNVSTLVSPVKCRPHDDCARRNRSKAEAIEANLSP